MQAFLPFLSPSPVPFHFLPLPHAAAHSLPRMPRLKPLFALFRTRLGSTSSSSLPQEPIRPTPYFGSHVLMAIDKVVERDIDDWTDDVMLIAWDGMVLNKDDRWVDSLRSRPGYAASRILHHFPVFSAQLHRPVQMG
jgi:hypothetical protein